MASVSKSDCANYPLGFNWSDVLSQFSQTSIASSTWSVPSGIVGLLPSISGSNTFIAVSGGTPGATYALKNTVVLAPDGYADCETLYITVT